MLEKTLESPLDCKEIKPINLKGNHLNIHWKDWCWSWSSNTLDTWCKEMTHWKRPWWWERLRAGEGGGRGWDGWMASPTQWTWVWATSRRWWRTGKPGVLQPMRSQKVGYDLVTEQLLRFILSQKDIKMLHRNVGFTSKIRTQLIFQGQFAELLYLFLFHYSVQFSRSVMSDSLGPHESQHARPPCPSPTPRVHSDSCPIYHLNKP